MYKDLGILQELCAIADSFAKQGIMPPTGYKQKSVNWIIEIDRSGQVNLQGPFQKGD
ncbi:MAG: hypothetical protein HC930_01840 [Hydrococcus sp. SU_1_0]|nr:hypothetical protein [Hydrococcus sp. SU_1_0]